VTASNRNPYDVVTFGETMLRFTPPALGRIEQVTSLDLHVGGSESNTAVGLARLGLHVAWLSRLTDNPLGRTIANTIRAHGVDTSQVVWTAKDRVGLYFLEEGKPPRGSQVLYDRQGSAMSRITPNDLPDGLFTQGTGFFHTTGITVALSETSAATVGEAVKRAKAAGWRVSFDVNYRARLWSASAARDGCHPIMRAADIIFIPQGDARLLFDFGPEVAAEAMLTQLAQTYPQADIIMSLGKDGAIGRRAAGTVAQHPVFETVEVGRLGGGDAFAAGVLYAYLHQSTGEPFLATALRWGCAAAALKYSLPGDLPLFDLEQVTKLVTGEAATFR
jgi:2-dehydro-3-deoxygluconokinase